MGLETVSQLDTHLSHSLPYLGLLQACLEKFSTVQSVGKEIVSQL